MGVTAYIGNVAFGCYYSAFMHGNGGLNPEDIIISTCTVSISQYMWCRVMCSLYLLLLGLEATARLSGLVTLLEFSVRSYLVGNAGSRPISEAKQPWACLVLRWGTTGEAHVLYSLLFCQVLVD